METKLFTSESVSKGHPDKVADQISDAFLDACLSMDSESKVACETLVTTGLVTLAGEVHTKAYVHPQDLARRVLRGIGYTHEGIGFEADSCAVISALHRQSQDIRQGVEDSADQQATGAGDQGMMFGYACNETSSYMPAPIYWAHRLMERHADLVKSGELPWLRPDAKSQVTFRYDGDRPVDVKTVVLSTQHADESMVSAKEVCAGVEEHIIRAVLPAELLTQTQILVNPTGRFVIGGPHGDAGLTGRKIIVDTYGGMARHGGGAFSGKDCTKVDRSAAYATRWIAKNLVAGGFAERCELQVAYAIGVSEPVSIRVDTFGTAQNGWDDESLAQMVRDLKPFEGNGRTSLPLTPDWIIERLGLRHPTGYPLDENGSPSNPEGWTYQMTAAHGHFGRTCFPWEKLDLVEEMKALATATKSI